MRYVLLVLFVAACSTAPATPTPQPRPALSVPADTAAVWTAALAALADQSIPIKSSDRASGLVTTEEVTIPASDTKAAGECSRGMGMVARPGRAQYTVLVGSAPAGTTLRVTARLTHYGLYGQFMGECVTTGALETRLEGAIRQRVTASAR